MDDATLHVRARRARRTLLIATVATLALYVIPFGRFVAYPLMLFSTYAHEMGHGLMAAVLGGTFESFRMWADGSGIAQHGGALGDVGNALVAAGGLVGPALLATFFFAVGRYARLARIVMVLFGAACLLSVALVVRNAFGIAFVSGVGILALLVAVKTELDTVQSVMVFLAVQLSLTVFSRGDYLFVGEAQTSGGTLPSDTAHIAMALGGTYWIWGALIGAFSVLVLAFGLWAFLRGPLFRSAAS